MPAIRSAWETRCHSDRRAGGVYCQFGQDQEENFKPVDGEAGGKIRGFELSSWNFIGHDSKVCHYGPWRKTSLRPSLRQSKRSAEPINSGDLAVLMIAVGAGERTTKLKEAQIAGLESEVEDRSETRLLETVSAAGGAGVAKEPLSNHSRKASATRWST